MLDCYIGREARAHPSVTFFQPATDGDENALVNETTPACANGGSVAVLVDWARHSNHGIMCHRDNSTTDMLRSGDRSHASHATHSLTARSRCRSWWKCGSEHCSIAFPAAKFGLSRLSLHRQAHLPAHLCMARLQDRAVEYPRWHSIGIHPEREVRHASTKSRDENAQSNRPDIPDQGIQNSAVKHSTVTLCRLFSATVPQFPST